MIAHFALLEKRWVFHKQGPNCGKPGTVFLHIQNQENFKFVFIDEARWSKEKVEYINNIKNGKKYEILEENQEKMKKSIDVSEVADIFDINKIEVE